MDNQTLNCRIELNTPFGAVLTPMHPGQHISELPVAACGHWRSSITCWCCAALAPVLPIHRY